MATEHKFYADNLVDALLEENIPLEQIWELDGWKTNQQDYFWTDVWTDQHNGYLGVANGHLNHHTASTGYTPYVKNSQGQTKANVWLGKRVGGRLYQNADSGVPTLAIASAGPANYSAGSGVRTYVKALKAGEKLGRQTLSDDDPKFYGNRYVWNTEIVCNGTGGSVDQDVWDLIVAYNAALARLHDSTEFWNGFHAGFTRRKIDYRDGRFLTAQATMEALWPLIAVKLGDDPVDPPVIEPPPIDPPIEPPPTERPMSDLKRSRATYLSAKNEDLTGLDVEYWQNKILQIGEQTPDLGTSTKTFFYAVGADAKGLTWKVWDQAMTDYFSAITGRNSYGLGPSERAFIDREWLKLMIAHHAGN